MKKIILSFITCLSIASVISAQSADDGKKLLYYEKLTTATQVFQKLVASNPKDVQAVYWLGQTYIANDRLDSAKALYQSTVSAGVNDPLLWVGSGEVDILQGGDINAAKQKFEQAITTATATKGKNKGQPDPNILNAIGRAMAAGNSTKGDPNYGIDKLKQAAQLNPQDPDIFINLGLCYRKLGGEHGGEAVTAYQQAISINAQYARAYYLIGRIYQSQRNKESMDEWYGKAITADPTFAPVYLQYFLFYSEKDVTTAKEYLDKYVANADKDCKTDFFVGNYLLRAGKYQESLQQAKTMEAGACKNYPALNLLYAYDYDRLGDSLQARSYLQKYFATADTGSIEPQSYAFAGSLLAKFPESSDSAGMYLQKAIMMDTVKQNQTDYLDSAVAIAAQSNNYPMLLQLINTMQKLSGTKLTETQYFDMAKGVTDAAQADSSGTFDSTKFMLGDSVLASYATAYPAKPQPYSFRVRFAKYSDRDTSRGLAVPAILQQNQYLTPMKDTSASAKQSIFRNDAYLLIYYAQYSTNGEKADNYRKAIAIADEMISLYPDAASEENKYAAGIKKQLQSALDKFQKSKTNTNSNTKTKP